MWALPPPSSSWTRLWPASACSSSLSSLPPLASSHTDQTPEVNIITKLWLKDLRKKIKARKWHNRVRKWEWVTVKLNLFPLLWIEQKVTWVKHNLMKLFVPSWECRHLHGKQTPTLDWELNSTQNSSHCNEKWVRTTTTSMLKDVETAA